MDMAHSSHPAHAHTCNCRRARFSDYLLSEITCFTGAKVQIMTQLEARVGRLGSLGRVGLQQLQQQQRPRQQLQHQQDRRQHARAPVSQLGSADHTHTQCSRELESGASGRRSASARVLRGAREGRHQFHAGHVVGSPLSFSPLSFSPLSSSSRAEGWVLRAACACDGALGRWLRGCLR